MTSPVDLLIEGGLARVVLNRPDSGNLLDDSMLAGLQQAIAAISAERGIRAALLAAAGDNFCFGGDVQAFARARAGLPETIRSLTTSFHASLSRLTRLDIPLVAAVQGWAAGGGFSLACTCDVVVAGESSRFVFAYPRIGLSPDGGLSLLLTRRAGMGRALDWALTNRPITAGEALEAGVISRVVPDSEVVDTSMEIAAMLARGPTRAYAVTRRLMLDSWLRSHADQLAAESDAMIRLGQTEDAQAAAAAFVTKTEPTFRGR